MGTCIFTSVLLWTLVAPTAGGRCVAPTESPLSTESGMPAGWVRTDEPTADQLRCANWATRAWQVGQTAGAELNLTTIDELRPRQDPLPWPLTCPGESPDLPARRIAKEVGDRWIVGCDGGSRGGGLWAFSADGRGAETLWHYPVREVEVIQGRLLVLGESTPGETAVLELSSKPRWTAQPRASVPGTPVGLISQDGDILVVTTAGLFAIGKGEINTQLMGWDLQHLYPTSIARGRHGEIVIGMRHYVVQIRPTAKGWIRDWLAPADCPSFRPALEGPCACAEEGQRR